jgi:hypothetical protein
MKEGVDNMAPGSVIVDLAGATGGTCEVIKRGETYVYDNRVTIIGTTDLISRMTWQASSMYYSNNMANLTCYAQGQGKNAKVLHQNRGSCNSWHGVRPRMSGHMVSATKPAQPRREKTKPLQSSHHQSLPSSPSGYLTLLLLENLLGSSALACSSELSVPTPSIVYFATLYFILAGFLLYYLIWAVEPALFSPLTSISKSLSGVVILVQSLARNLNHRSGLMPCLLTIFNFFIWRTLFFSFVRSLKEL